MSDSAPRLGADGFPLSDWKPPARDVQLAPGGEAAARAAGIISPDPPPPPAAAPVAAAPAAPKPKARLARRAGLEERVSFDWPVEFEGKTYDGVTIRRLTVGALAEFMESRGDAPRTGAVFRYPIYFDDGGEPMPDEVLDAVEMTDHAKVVKVTERFLPPAFMGEAG